MITPEEVYRIWAPEESVWSPWAIPVPFAQMMCFDTAAPPDLSEMESVAAQFEKSPDLAIVADLPGVQAVKLGLALARRGFRPVPAIDGSPGPGLTGLGGGWMDQESALPASPGIAVDMRLLLRGLCSGATLLRDLTIAPDASPVFLLDAMRMADGRLISQNVFDNRWKTFPQDFPSARFLQERGIQRVVLIQEFASQPKEDLSHVLLRWQEAGIRLEVFGTNEGDSPRQLVVDRPSYFRRLWQRAVAILDLRRGVSGGFGNWPHGTGGG